MRIEFDHTPDDWRAYVRFVGARTRTALRRNFWAGLIGSAAFAALAIASTTGALASSSSFALIFGVAAVALIWDAALRWRRSAAVVPESWLGSATYELRDDGIAVTTSTGSSLIEWRAVKGVDETTDHLFVRIDQITSVVLPKRHLESCGGAQAVRAEIERRVAQARGEPMPSTAVPALSNRAQAPASTPTRAGSPLAQNLLAGLWLFEFVPVSRENFTASARQVIWLAAIALATWVLLDRLRIDGDAEIMWFSVQQVLVVVSVAVALLVILAPGSARSEGSLLFVTAIAAAAPCLVLLGVLLETIDDDGEWVASLFGLGMVAVVVYRAARVAADELPAIALSRAVFVVGVVFVLFESVLYGYPPQFWFPPQEAEEVSDTTERADAERELFRQPELVDAALSRVAAGTKGVPETYFVGFAGYGHQRVFDKEVRFAQHSLAERIDLAGRTALLINSREPDGETPLATVSGLRRTLAGVARRMNLDEDFLVLFLTSHGGANAELSVAQDTLPLDGLRGGELRDALDEARIRWRIVVISACHSASFIPHLENPDTLVATASRADRRSMGCSDDRELTYYGEALFRDALPQSGDWLDALERTRAIVERHEQEENVAEKERSEPQVFVGERMRKKLAELKFRSSD